MSTTSEAISVGKDILAYCSKCKLQLNHIIVTMKDEKKPHKVECQTCKRTHVFKLAPGTKKKRTTKKKSPALPIGEVWEQAIAEATGDYRSYGIKESFGKGDLIIHKKFGEGVVEELVDNDKISVIFKTEIKTLVHNK